MMIHETVPHQFQRGTIIPLMKDRHGNKSDMNNYRGITIAPIISKIFEYSLQMIFQKFLTTSKYQFGFKRKSSTSHALFCLQDTPGHDVNKRRINDGDIWLWVMPIEMKLLSIKPKTKLFVL